MVELRQLRPVPDPLGSYIRPSSRDHKVLLQRLVDGGTIGTGLVADPCLITRQHDLLEEARKQGIETILDPRTVDLSTVGGITRSGVTDLPWGGSDLHTPTSLAGPTGNLVVQQITAWVETHDLSAVLAPTHFVETETDPWFEVDRTLTQQLRQALDSRGLRTVPIYYPLTIRSTLLHHPDRRAELIATIAGLPVDAIWLRVHPFGTTSEGPGPLALRRYLETCRAMHALRVPLVAEHSGTVGVALLAFGAIGGVESGLTLNEAVNINGYLRRPDPKSKPFAPAPRIYLHEIGAFLATSKGDKFFATRGIKTAHGCRNSECCPRGWLDMQLDPRRHFVTQRAQEVAELSAVPETLRAGYYMEQFLRPATDRALIAAKAEPALENARKRLESWRGTLGSDLTTHSAFTISAPAAGKRLRRSA